MAAHALRVSRCTMIGLRVRLVGECAALVALATLLPAFARAQDRHVVGGGRVAGIAPPPPPAPIIQPGFSQPGFSQIGYQPYGAPVVGSVPVVVYPDGRVFADFG